MIKSSSGYTVKLSHFSRRRLGVDFIKFWNFWMDNNRCCAAHKPEDDGFVLWYCTLDNILISPDLTPLLQNATSGSSGAWGPLGWCCHQPSPDPLKTHCNGYNLIFNMERVSLVFSSTVTRPHQTPPDPIRPHQTPPDPKTNLAYRMLHRVWVPHKQDGAPPLQQDLEL